MISNVTSYIFIIIKILSNEIWQFIITVIKQFSSLVRNKTVIIFLLLINYKF